MVTSLLGSADWGIRKDGSDGELAFLLARSRELVTRVRDAVIAC